jgi:hypothetical protein
MSGKWSEISRPKSYVLILIFFGNIKLKTKMKTKMQILPAQKTMAVQPNTKYMVANVPGLNVVLYLNEPHLQLTCKETIQN